MKQHLHCHVLQTDSYCRLRAVEKHCTRRGKRHAFPKHPAPPFPKNRHGHRAFLRLFLIPPPLRALIFISKVAPRPRSTCILAPLCRLFALSPPPPPPPPPLLAFALAPDLTLYIVCVCVCFPDPPPGAGQVCRDEAIGGRTILHQWRTTAAA
ncbi:unnamed protein product, partial [Laminaria digitata]